MGKPRSRQFGSVILAALVAFATLLLPAAPAAAEPADPLAAAAAVEPAVARIDTVVDYQQAYGVGTGFVLSPNGEVLTNYHVVQGANTINATVNGASFMADLVGYNRRADIAVLQLRGAGGLPTASIGDSRSLVEGEPVVALGNAYGSNAPLTREVGTVTAFGRTVNAEDSLTGTKDELTGLIEFAAPVRAGDSGGPVVDGAGQVVGVTTAASVNFRMGPGGKGFAIPINDAMAVANQIRSRTPSPEVHIGPPTLLGVGVRTAQRSGGGVIIQDVLRGGPAEAAGLVPGDILMSIEGTLLDTARTLTLVLDQHYPGDVVDLTWRDRGGFDRNGKATLAAGP
ncbi:S1C family serine protease [Mycolicibacterium smegmatis]|nr:S1C family serine protease [Mycolicibacterium smegmatis]ABK70561.1 Trypsin [Mycolicibacterium smegmatis MC2 155]AIU11278.1 serine protease [Mycolicibacterium smegmatis MC2 155]AIU17902.1 serine protease [Mycolicibacterium smegmatis]AIU24526.1 serine protease [Mycolicibacterium smegmatis]MBE9616359.1 serine protease [Mycolicibacterium smegmatis]